MINMQKKIFLQKLAYKKEKDSKQVISGRRENLITYCREKIDIICSGQRK